MISSPIVIFVLRLVKRFTVSLQPGFPDKFKIILILIINIFQSSVGETSTPSRPDDPPLLPGEKVQGTAKEVTYLCPYSGPARGTLSVTNYKLNFRSVDRDTPYVIEVPLGVVSFLFIKSYIYKY